jgi:hypothetical protein
LVISVSAWEIEDSIADLYPAAEDAEALAAVALALAFDSLVAAAVWDAFAADAEFEAAVALALAFDSEVAAFLADVAAADWLDAASSASLATCAAVLSIDAFVALTADCFVVTSS